MKPVIFHPEAMAELDAAIGYYEAQGEDLGLDLLTEIERLVMMISQNPALFSIYKDPNIRRFPLRRFPYLLYYQDREESILIVALAHQRRRPNYWMTRI